MNMEYPNINEEENMVANQETADENFRVAMELIKQVRESIEARDQRGTERFNSDSQFISFTGYLGGLLDQASNALNIAEDLETSKSRVLEDLRQQVVELRQEVANLPKQ